MDWSKAILEAIPPMAAVAAVGIAYLGLNTWKRETTARKQLELAELVLADFYEAKDVMNYVRNPGSYEGEAGERPGAENEPDDLRRWRDTRAVALKRMSDKSEFFAGMYARRYRVMALFGPEAAAPYDRFHSTRNEVIVSAQMLVQSDPNDPSEDQELRRGWERDIGWCRRDDDRIRIEIDEIIEEVERLFRPKVEAVIKPA